MVRKRNRRKKALYEVMGGPGSKSGCNKPLDQPPSDESGREVPSGKDPAAQVSAKPPGWPIRPRMVRINAGRVEISLPYQIAIAILLGVILLILIFFRLGQGSSVTAGPAAQVPAGALRESGTAVVNARQTPGTAEKTGPARSKGDHLIVITQYHTRRDLLPVQKYFAANGIETVIEKRGNRFFLVTKNAYKNTQKRGSDGYAVKKAIVEAGAGYKAPPNYESFAPNLFSDAYGEKIK